MRLIFCSDPLRPRYPDPVFEAEVVAARRLGIAYDLIDYEALVHDHDPSKAVRRVTEQPASRPGLFRGWMLTPGQYSQLYAVLAGRGLRLINDPAAYRRCHYLPEWYPLVRDHTPASVWMAAGGAVAIDRVMDLLRPFGSRPVIVKDFVKSRKHDWDEACYIPSASDRQQVESVVRRFLELQGEELNEGLVFREFVPFEPFAKHSRSGMPLTQEWRLFVLDGEPIVAAPYWEEGDYKGTSPPVDQFRDLARAIPSRFFTLDVAKRLDGPWMLVELGDAQVAGLPRRAHVLEFYRSLQDRWPA